MNPKATYTDDIRGAYHEAGHVVAFYALGWHLRPDCELVGVYLRDAAGRSCAPHCNMKHPDDIRGQIAPVMVDLAGLIAEKHYADAIRQSQASSVLDACAKLDPRKFPAEQDLSLATEDAVNAICKLTALCDQQWSSERKAQEAAKLLDKVEQGLLINGSAIEAVAARLMQARSMTSDELKDLLGIDGMVRRIDLDATTHTCIYSKVPFADSDAEHILQNFLGARWTSTAIVSNPVQRDFGRTIDVALEQGLQQIRNLLGTKGGRGGAGPTLMRVPTTAGELIDLEPGGKPRIAKPIVVATKRADGKRVIQITLGTIDQLGWALALLRQQIPDLTVDANEVRALAKSVQGFIPGQVHLQTKFGGKDYFRGVLKSCINLLGACHPSLALNPCFDAARSFVLTGTGEMADFVRFSNQEDPLHIRSLGKADHFIGIASLRGGVEGIVQFFGEVIHPVCLASTYTGESFQYGYHVNPFRDSTPAESRDLTFETSCIPPFIKQAEFAGPEVWAAFTVRMKRLMHVYQAIGVEELVELAIKEVLVPEDGKPFTEELVGRFSRKVAELVTRVNSAE